MSSHDVRQRGFTLIEALVAMSLVASVGVIASVAAAALLRLESAAHAEAAGLSAAAEKIEQLLALPPASRRSGNDETLIDGVALTRVWRVLDDDPARGLTRVEVSARWEAPSLTILTLVAVAPGRSAP